MKRDISTLTDIWLCALVVYAYGQDVLVGIDITSNEFNRKVTTYTVNVPSCDLQLLQEQYHAKDETLTIIPKDFVEAHQFITGISRDATRSGNATWRSIAWQRGLVG